MRKTTTTAASLASLALLLFVAGCGGSSSGGSDSSNSSDSSNNVAERSEESWADEVAQERKAAYEKSQANKNLSVGDTADVRGFKITVNDIQRVPHASEVGNPKMVVESDIPASDTFVALDVTFANEGDRPVTFAEVRNFRFVDNNGQKLNNTAGVISALMKQEEEKTGRRGIGSLPFEPGQMRQDVFVYSLPKESELYLEYTPRVEDFGDKGNPRPNQEPAARWYLADKTADLPSRF